MNLALVSYSPKAIAYDIRLARLAFNDISKIPDINMDFHLAAFG